MASPRRGVSAEGVTQAYTRSGTAFWKPAKGAGAHVVQHAWRLSSCDTPGSSAPDRTQTLGPEDRVRSLVLITSLHLRWRGVCSQARTAAGKAEATRTVSNQ